MDPNWPAHYTVGPRQGIRLIRKGEDPGWGEIIYVTTIYIYIYISRDKAGQQRTQGTRSWRMAYRDVRSRKLLNGQSLASGKGSRVEMRNPSFSLDCWSHGWFTWWVLAEAADC